MYYKIIIHIITEHNHTLLVKAQVLHLDFS